jgi:hypothetical protein
MELRKLPIRKTWKVKPGLSLAEHYEIGRRLMLVDDELFALQQILTKAYAVHGMTRRFGPGLGRIRKALRKVKEIGVLVVHQEQRLERRRVQARKVYFPGMVWHREMPETVEKQVQKALQTYIEAAEAGESLAQSAMLFARECEGIYEEYWDADRRDEALVNKQ